MPKTDTTTLTESTNVNSQHTEIPLHDDDDLVISPSPGRSPEKPDFSAQITASLDDEFMKKDGKKLMIIWFMYEMTNLFGFQALLLLYFDFLNFCTNKFIFPATNGTKYFFSNKFIFPATNSK